MATTAAAAVPTLLLLLYVVVVLRTEATELLEEDEQDTLLSLEGDLYLSLCLLCLLTEDAWFPLLDEVTDDLVLALEGDLDLLGTTDTLDWRLLSTDLGGWLPLPHVTDLSPQSELALPTDPCLDNDFLYSG